MWPNKVRTDHRTHTPELSERPVLRKIYTSWVNHSHHSHNHGDSTPTRPGSQSRGTILSTSLINRTTPEGQHEIQLWKNLKIKSSVDNIAMCQWK